VSTTTPPVNDAAWTPFYRRTFALVTAAIIGVLLFAIVQPFFGPLAWALLFAFLLQPWQRQLTRRVRGRHSVAALLLTIATGVLVIGPLGILGTVFVNQGGELITALQTHLQSLQIDSVREFRNLPWIDSGLDWIQAHTGFTMAQLQSWAVSGSEQALQTLTKLGGAVFVGTLSTLVGFVVMLMLLFFLVRDGESMMRAAVHLVPMAEARKESLLDYLGAVTRAVVVGTLVTAAVQGLLLGVGFAIVGLPSPVVFGVLGAVLSVVPFGGTAIVWLPGVLWLASQGQYGSAVFLAIWGVGPVSSIDQFLRPLLISGRTEIPTLAVFIGVLGGLAAFGFLGLFIGPVVIALAIALLKFAGESIDRTTPPSQPRAPPAN
jgi:predicted PurR-regulated permease PerM